MTLVGNEVIEKDVRDHLECEGYSRRSAEFSNLELVAVEPPGWVQVFSFNVRLTDNSGKWTKRYGLCRDDERYRQSDVEIFNVVEQQKKRLDTVTLGLITAGGSGNCIWPVLVALLLVPAVFVAIAVVCRLLST